MQFKSIQFKGEQNMDIIIKDLNVDAVDKFISQDADRYGRVTRKETRYDHTVDLLFNVRHFGVDEDRLIFVFPNEGSLVVPVSQNEYLKIEVM